MFGESESESPRVPSPWDSLISTPASSSPGPSKTHTPSPLSVELIPRLVPESDDGNVEYKLQLLNPSHARFARLVTQLKWRLLEGGGQAYYELGVADSGDLIGLSRDELEQTLETLEMMAGEIGASVIVVKEIEVPPALASFAKVRSKRGAEGDGLPSSFSSIENGYAANASTTETETEGDSLSGTDVDESQNLTRTITLERPETDEPGNSPVFAMDPEAEASNAPDNQLFIPVQSQFCVDLEISSVFKPRPMKARIDNHPRFAHVGGRNKQNKKIKPTYVKEAIHDTQPELEAGTQKSDKALHRRKNRDKRREEKRKTLEEQTSLDNNMLPAMITSVSPADTDTLVDGLKKLHVGVVETVVPELDPPSGLQDGTEDDSDLFGPPTVVAPSFPTFTMGESHLQVDSATFAGVVVVAGSSESSAGGGGGRERRLIVEALVVRKMSLEEAFLDFEGFSCD